MYIDCRHKLISGAAVANIIQKASGIVIEN